MQLTPSQKKAVAYNKGPLLIIAGAGTGKTTVLVEKIKYILKKKLAKPEEILALTFTEKAATQMEERVDKALPYGYFQMNISTFHSFCDKILRSDSIHIGLSSGYKLYSQAESIIFLKQNLFHFNLDYFRPLSNPNKFLEGILQHFSRLKDENVAPYQYIDWAKSICQNSKVQNRETKIECKKYLELANAYKQYQNLKVKKGIFDFSDLIFFTIKLFTDRPNILKKYQQQFKYILIDEFQDTNIAQYELIKLLAPIKNKPNLTVIGDDNQSIYKFRGASISNILQFMDDYTTSKSIILTESFRSNQQILDTAYRLIKHNDPDTLEAKLKIPKELKSRTGRGSEKSVRFHLSDRVEEEAEYITTQIQKLKDNYNFNDVAILVRANNHADPFVRALSRKGIPYQFLGPGMLFKQPEVKDLMAFFNVLVDINDSTAFYRVLTMDVFDLDNRDIASLISFCRNTGRSLFETMEIYLSFFFTDLKNDEFLPYKENLFLTKKESQQILYKIYQVINRALSLLKKETAGQILYFFLEESGYLQKLMNHTSEKDERIALNISKFFDRLKTFEIEHEDASVFTTTDYLTMCMELGDSPTSQQVDMTEYDGVNILTVHAGKGLEFPIVFLVNLTQERFPTRQRKEQVPIPDALIKEILPLGDYHMEEERRLFYVGLTRAKDYCFMTSSNFYGEGKRERKISPFIFESIGKDNVQKIVGKVDNMKKQLSFFDFKKIEEKEPKKIIIQSDTFSYSQLETYKICPLRYKYQYIIKIPIPPNPAGSFGETVHITLQKFYELYSSGKHIDFNKMMTIYHDAWIPQGFTSRRYEEKMKLQGEKMLKIFYKEHHNKEIKIMDLERRFKIKLEQKIYLVGKIDRVDKKNRQYLEIIDYKTGKVPTEPKLKKDLQMGIYALAAKNPGLYDKKLTEITLSFYFLQENKIISLHKTSKELDKVTEEIIKIVNEINISKFQPKVGIWCNFCPFKINCEAWQ
ncbi:hypothetical protein A3C23_03075 [Candidatus Roizmanbacteria bacterium RIFCSPHIGHO2_02_FULL_37_13b]|uniref:DNA 3'-5' helicase n=1 Tax=Candidatus Roizmanbacteria bacterium RIFCSPLOWO2_02_FULL_36_11 TaxID=1802071 RepID=A0A1F7JI93_9BACT|nr:MAG: hypothetical protein A3C23_03075 [Candidatus Roizmanbacteria bacterium RIFCSPHIGHO2_02_FULL_37_13b]OGK55333.1 MAG: hypothetical protein A3H78_04510 [Candidatus Roizmanbacteria bacterium RIFCSPLOWO2_02_FULL_36_11]